jgi:ABC-type glycerol-3-phosphate transport system substrate-binding protein
MKKIFILAAAVGLMAAGCSSSQTASVDTSARTQQETAVAMPTPTETQSMVQADAQANAVNNSSDAVNLLVNDSTKEQSTVRTSDDSDVTASDSTSLNSFTGVSNGY